MMMFMCGFQVELQSRVTPRCSSSLNILSSGILFILRGMKLVLSLLVNSNRFVLNEFIVRPVSIDNFICSVVFDD